MMHECPKCRFVQPKDRYCANCGLDIETYIPAPEPTLKKFGKNTSLHISIVVFLTLAVAVIIYFREKDKIMAHIKNAPHLLSMSKRTVPTESNEADPQKSGGEIVVSQSFGEAAAPATAEQTQAAAHTQQELVFTFVEASAALLQQLATEGQILNETAQRRSFVHTQITSIDKLKERDPEFKILRGGQSFSLKLNTPMSFDFTHLSGTQNEDVGLSLEVSADSLTENLIDISMVGTLNLKDDQGQSITSQEINANFSFAPKNTLIMVGFLPRQQIRPDDIALFSNTPLAIYESPQFIAGITDFVIFVQVK